MHELNTTHLEVLNEVARIATLDVELRPMLQRITDTLAQRCAWEFVALVTIDHERKAFVCDAVTASVATDIHPGYTRPLGSGIVGQVAATGRPIVIDDVREWPAYVETMAGAESEICVPVIHHGAVIAVLNLESTRKAAFREQLHLLTTVADQISGALANAQMVSELRQRARLMEMMSQVSRHALEATDSKDLVERIVQYIQERFPLEITAIAYYDRATDELIHGADAGGVEIERESRWPVTEGLIGRGIREGRTLLVPDVSADPSYVSLNPRVQSELVIPIRFHGEILGALNLESAAPETFSPANVLAFEAFADQVAGALHMSSVNARLNETTRLLELKTRALEEANEHLAGAIETLHRISTQDGLTGVSNRRHFDETLATEWRRCARKDSPLALLLLDIDHFKTFNDTAGHQAGDDCLRRVAQTLHDSLHRASDLVARYGGEEFAILLPETDPAHARRFAEILRARVEESRLVTISVGVACIVPTRDGSGIEQFVGSADRALYEAKRAGRNRVRPE